MNNTVESSAYKMWVQRGGIAVAAVHGHCAARVLDRASFPMRDDEAACGRGGLRAFGGPASRPEPSVDKTRPRRRSGYPGRGRGQKHPFDRSPKGRTGHAPRRHSCMPPSSGGLPPARTTPRTETHRAHAERVAQISRSQVAGWWLTRGRRRITGHVDAATGAQKLTAGWRLMMPWRA